MPQSQIGETDHFWYRLQPEGVYIDSQRDDFAEVLFIKPKGT